MELISEYLHLSHDGIKKILKLRAAMNDGGKRKFSDIEIISELESSETIRQTPLEKIVLNEMI